MRIFRAPPYQADLRTYTGFIGTATVTACIKFQILYQHETATGTVGMYQVGMAEVPISCKWREIHTIAHYSVYPSS